MFVKVEYFGFYPLGADVYCNGVRIMQASWEKYRFPVFIIGKKQAVDPAFGQVFYAENDGRTVFFVAVEYGHGHYHIFSLSDKAQKKMSRKLKNSR